MTDVFASLRVATVDFDDDFVLLALADGRRTRQPLRWAPALYEADALQRAQWVLTPDGLGVNWPALLPARKKGVVDVPNQVWDDRYEAALARLKSAGWSLDALSDEDQQLVALWRMEADINNGGFMQFLCNWATRPASWRCARCRQWVRCRPTRSWQGCVACWTGWRTTRKSRN